MPRMNASCFATSVLPTPVGPENRNAADRLLGLAEARPRHLDRRGERLDRRVLAEHDVLQVALDGGQLAAVVGRHVLRRDPRDLRDDLLDLDLADGLLALGRRQDALRGTGLVDHVDRLVGQVTVVDEARGELGRRGQRGGRILDAVVFLEARLEAAQDLHRLLDGRLVDVDLLEATRQRVVLLEDAAVFVVRRRADALQLAGRQRRLEQVRRVERAARGGTRADQRVDLVDEQDRVAVLLELLEHGLEPLLEVAAVLGARQQRAHVERIHLGLLEDLGHVLLRDAPRQALGDGGLADAGLADQQRVVLPPAAQHLDHALDLGFAADQRIDLALLRERR